jgi:cyclophilin family peptidyl-prolyl cis-trans isomerase
MVNKIAVFDTTQGKFKVELFQEKAPGTTKNFIDLVNKGFYNGLIFHRVIPNFMIQCGCPNGIGNGGPGYVIKDEFHKELSNVRGTLAMANRGPNTGGSQFFINIVDNTYLDFDKPPASSKHPVFGKVIHGMDVIDKLAKMQTGRNDKPLTDVVIKKVTIE